MADVDQEGKQPKPPNEAAGVDALKLGRPTPKRIVVCCDGTGNEFAGVDAKDSNSNVVKFYTALQLGYEQYAYYHPGVGTMGDPTKKGLGRLWSQVEGLAFGKGFEENVLDAYRYLMQHFNAGDTVYLIGFSRGAYTARALAGLLHGYGLLCRGNEGHIPYAWRMYTQKVQDQLQQNRHTIEPDFSFRDTFCHPTFMLHFVGLWDTVSSVGWISTPLRLLHLAQNPTIVYGRHAISIDERRCFYQDNIWGPPVEVLLPPALCGTDEGAKVPKVQNLLQAWFCGVHSDVGGSYPQLQSGLSNVTLEWMMKEAESCGVVFDPLRRKVVLGETVTAAQDPCKTVASLEPLYEKPKSSPVHKSLTLPWWLLEIFPHRYYTSDDGKEKMRIPLGAFRNIPAGSLIHASVKKRMHEDICYRPPNISPEEIVAPAHGTVPAGYFVFEPKRCRTGSWRENWFVVFLISVLEVAIGLYLAARLLLWTLEFLNRLGHVVIWFGRNILPKSQQGPTIWVLDRIRPLVVEATSPHRSIALHWLWLLAIAAVIVAVNFVFARLRRGRS